MNSISVKKKKLRNIDFNKIEQDLINTNNKIIINSYKKFCEYLNIYIYSSEPYKRKQLELLKNILDFTYDKNTYNYIISGIKYIIRENSNIIYKKLKIRKPNFDKRAGVYKIYNDNEIYIGSSRKLYDRFTDHYKNINNDLKITQEILKNGGTFEVIEFFDLITDKGIDKKLQEKEYEIIEKYIKDYDSGVEKRKLLNHVVKNSDGSLINPFHKSKKDKFIRCKINSKDKDLFEEIMNDNNIYFKFY